MSQPEPLAAEAERRVSARIPVNTRATLVLGHLGSATPCVLLDLSLDGCRVRTDSEIRINAGERLELVLRLGASAFRVGGVTEWTGRTRDFGVRFTGMSPRREAELVEALAELAAACEVQKEEGRRADEALKRAQELVAKRMADLEAVSAREAAIRAEADQAGREKREAEERLKSAKKEQSEAEKAAEKFAWLAEAEAGTDAVVAEAATATGAPGGVGVGETRAAGGLEGGSSRRERRQSARHAVDSTATVFLVDVRSNVRGRIVDVSLSGCRIRSAERFPVGIYRRVEVEFLLDGLPFRLPGVVQSLHDPLTAGIRFIDLSERKREQLLYVIEEMAEAS